MFAQPGGITNGSAGFKEFQPRGVICFLAVILNRLTVYFTTKSSR